MLFRSPFSVIHSPFEEVLYLDADSFPTRNPEYLFDLPEYKESGSIFWPDLPPSGRKEWIPRDVWEMWGLQYDSGPDLESGQFLVNKSRCWHELQVTMWLNEHSDWVYKHVYGDKSTYNLAWSGCNTHYASPRKLPAWDHPMILQYDLEGDLIFQHCCQGKQQLAQAVTIPNLNNAQWAVDAIKELSKYWDGQIYHQKGELSLGKFRVKLNREIEYSWKVVTTFAPPSEFDLDLLQGGYIRGSTLGFRNWYLKSENEIYFMSKGKLAHRFIRVPGTNRWRDETHDIDGTLLQET